MTPEERELVDASFKTMDLESKDLIADRIEQLKALFPEIAVEGEGTIDFEKLRLILGDEIDEGQERYAFTWPGKADAIRQAQTPSTATLRPDKANSVDWDTTENLYIEGDNLEVLKLLQRGYHGKVKMIYIDPPYNTGHDFVYKDSFQDSIENYKEQSGLSGQSNADTSGRYHSDWLSMMYPRLRLARELLSNNGAIFISINDIEAANLIEVCNELFGVNNLVADLIWTNKEGGGSSDSKLFRIKHEHILCYAKNIELLRIKGLPVSNEDRYREQDEFVKERGPYYLQKLGMGSIQYSSSLDYPIEAPDGTAIHPADNNQGKKACWRWSSQKLEWGKENGYVVIKKDRSGVWTVYTKQYLNFDNDGNPIDRTQRPMGIIDEFSSTQAAKLLRKYELDEYFDYSKPIELISYLVERLDSADIVLDFFSGSGTTGEAVFSQHRNGNLMRFILVQLPEIIKGDYENLCEVGEDRIRRAGQKIKAEIEEENKQLKLGEDPKPIPDIGFRILKLDSSNFDDVPDGALYDNIVKPDRSKDDIIFEMMLKWGLDLSLPMEDIEIEGYPVTSIAADELICCMDEGLTVSVLEAIAAREPKRVFFLDSVLTDSIKLNAAQIFKRVGDKLGYEIELRTV